MIPPVFAQIGQVQQVLALSHNRNATVIKALAVSHRVRLSRRPE
jgi:hypothetical protein